MEVISESSCRISTNESGCQQNRRLSVEKSGSKKRTVKLIVRRNNVNPSLDNSVTKSKKRTTVCVAKRPQVHQAKQTQGNVAATTNKEIKSIPKIKQHKILGSVNDYEKNCSKSMGSENMLHKKFSSELQPAYRGMHLKNEKIQNVNETKDEKALNNWNKHMKMRHRQIKMLLEKSKNDQQNLLMNKAEDHRSVQELKELIDRAIPSVDIGKGYRFNSEFWQQTEHFGDEETGIETTLTRPQKGQRSFPVQIGKPLSIKEETGSSENQGKERKWMESEYLLKRQKELSASLTKVVPHKANVEFLEIRGKTFETCVDDIRERSHCPGADKTVEYPVSQLDDQCEKEENNEPLFCSRLVINGCSVQGCNCNNIATCIHQSETVIRILLDSFSKCIGSENVIFTNSGDVSLTVSLKRRSNNNSFMSPGIRPIQRFYCDCNEFYLQPGETVTTRFAFKSPNPGIFMESWIVSIQPKCFEFGNVILKLRGVAMVEDDLFVERESLANRMKQAECNQIVTSVVAMILGGITEPVRPQSPINLQETDQDKFNRANSGLQFNADIVDSINRLCRNYQLTWNYSVSNIFKLGDSITDDNEKENFYKEANSLITNLHQKRDNKISNTNIYSSITQGLISALDKFQEMSLSIYKINNLQERTFTAVPIQEESHKKNKKGNDLQKGQERSNDSRKEKRDSAPSPMKSKQQQRPNDGVRQIVPKDHISQGASNGINYATSRKSSPVSGLLHVLMYNLLDKYILKYSNFE